MIIKKEKIINILLCDDDPVDRKLIRAYVSKLTQYNFEFTEAGEEEEIIIALERGGFDLILLDIQMPGRTGLEWLAELSKRKIAPVIILTGHGSEMIAVDAMKNGAADYLPKSELNFENLNRTVNNALEKWALLKKLEEYQIKLEYLARTDELTGLMNRRSLMERLVEEISRATRYNHPLSVLIMDIDCFKKINDVYGHLEGDKVIEDTSKMILESIRNIDFSGRYGGDEFVIILPETSLNEARKIGERIRSKIAHSVVFRDGDIPIKYTVSIGGVQLSDVYHLSSDELLKKADDALYQAKHKGGNLICC